MCVDGIDADLVLIKLDSAKYDVDYSRQQKKKKILPDMKNARPEKEVPSDIYAEEKREQEVQHGEE